MTSLQLVNLTKEYENGVYGVRDINLDIIPGEFIVLVGPSGCGKSTLLRLIAGLETISAGELRFDGVLMNEASARQRDIGMVFQNYALYPHLNVFENLAFPLRVRKIDRAQCEARVKEVASLLSIGHLLDRLPKQLSGGQRQRVAVGRAIVRNPRVFLFDEPLSNLDANLRVEMRSELSALQKSFGTTSVYVTHDHVEAMTMGDRIVVLNNGRVMQVGSPQELYSNPDNDFVAGFLGTPSINFFEGSITHDDGLRFVDTELGLNVSLSPTLFTRATAAPQKIARCALRAEDLELAVAGSTGDFQATVEMVEYIGHESIIHIRRGSQLLSIRSYDTRVPRRGERASFSLRPSAILLFDEHGRRL